ncbi:putative glutamine amidotransferase DUG3 [Neolecta irregularis DAH-3]|uniref:Putative glutamine amidotransferase DUG3 n=1 Tax=Neolecta irregularis (strain DAH-3) TaxID=1198029 RepID=A0A1U7LTW1_NEOID|nr:putative glutamine amidotransferase DUG3 [Neolecta irregularis DAH-3]|eukprot:OLL25982.1 putative glutamine amidotransferase DUG3 [Neolecta irregularis DAH-3]
MCRLLLYKGCDAIVLAHLLTNPSHSLIHQSFDARLRLDHARPINGDGHGIGYYSNDTTNHLHLTPCIYNSVIPAWNDSNLARLAEKTRSRLVFAHIRASTAGSLSETNCHPWAYNSFMWMHNGSVASFKKIKRKLQASLTDQFYDHVQGGTDSEWSFALFLQKLQDRGVDPSRQGVDFGHSVIRAAMLDTISQLISWINDSTTNPEPSLLNFCVTDGFSVVCTRYISSKTSTAASLYFISGSKFVQIADGQYKMERKDKGQEVIMIASEPLTWDPKNPWIAVPTNCRES